MPSSFCVVFREWTIIFLLDLLSHETQLIHEGSENPFLQIIVPEKIGGNVSDNSEVQSEQISYFIPINETMYTVHLKRRYFLADDFMTYLYNQGSMESFSSDKQAHCYYQGYVEEHPNSVVILSTCSGLRGILQFENVSYGIEPLESVVESPYLVYKLGNENKEFSSLNNDSKDTGKHPMDYNIYIDENLEPPALDVFPLYLEVHIVVDKALYEYLGSDSMIVTNTVIKVIGLVNTMFIQFKVSVVLSSLELWSDDNKIPTTGEADELLHAFLKWKHTYLASRPHDVAYLFIYRDYPAYVGAVFPAKICNTDYSVGIAVYPKEITLEAFSVIVTQMLGLSLGISYDDPKKCHCPGAICVMNPEAVTSSGAKTFSSCSLSDLRSFISSEGARCLQNKPQMQRHRPQCGNGRVETGEVCDCGNEQQCGPDSCCNHRTCRLKDGMQCLAGACCFQCRFREVGHLCRPQAHPECDLPEYCSGTSENCPPDITLHNGNPCRNGKLLCFGGNCYDDNEHCESVFGEGSKTAPFACYEEIHSHTDRYGHCGKARNNVLRNCNWRNTMCGRLVCTYTSKTPFYLENSTVIYAFVGNDVCVTIDYSVLGLHSDPLQIRNGFKCDDQRICVNQVCVEVKYVKNASQHCAQKCHGHGMCTSLNQCHCSNGYLPPNCERRARVLPAFPERKGKCEQEKDF
ncbi:disintegrin and metalloproteinase domain-containing protein 32-like [Ochotona princeps]|uniref:disintegrin and metalloproteinase domain-containing protein 32-like n=1 Tax=Ochotona princeps TaxID=9978 RepID=UPI002714FEE3|nr:disintegrin and metalloproteinase domain-containing protein 32-like [Ochotona princeps]